MEKLLKNINESCAQYFSKELDETSFQKVIDEIPTEFWQNKESALEIVRTLVENENLYEVSLEKPVIYAQFVCDLLPQSFRENSDYILATAEIIADFFEEFDEGLGSFDLDAVFSCMPHTPWEDEKFATAAANIVIDRSYSMALNCISEVIPESVWKSENKLCWLVRRLFNEDERNMTYLSIFPQKSWEYSEVISEIFSCLACAIENDREWGTVYGNFRGRLEEYMETFLSYVPEKFKSDKDLISCLLQYDIFYNALDIVLDWIDQSLWSDKDFVLQVLEIVPHSIIKISDDLATDSEIIDYINENIDFDWNLSGIPQENIPQWIKDWEYTD